MNKKQYNNIIENTLKYEQSAQSEDSLATARAIFDNMGVALPSGDIKTVCETIKTNDYMGWRECSAEEAQEAANEGVAAIGISEDKIVVISATDEEEPVAQIASVMTLDETVSAYSVSDLSYYSYTRTTTSDNIYFANEVLNVKVGWSGYNNLYGSTTPSIYWYSDNTDVVEVEEVGGYIKAVGVGTAWVSVVTANGKSDKFSINVESFSKYVAIEETVSGAVIGDILFGQAYRVHLNISYNIDKIKNGKAYISEVSAFTKYDKGNMMDGLEYPHITIGELKINKDTYRMQADNRPIWISPDWKWDAKAISLNKWYDIGSDISVLSIIMLDSTLFAYRDVKLETELNIN